MLRKISFVTLLFVIIAVFNSVVFAQEGGFSLTIMHTNDVHGAYGPYDGTLDGVTDGGAAREMTVINQIRAEGGNTILVDGGDRFTGTLFHQQWRGVEASRIMNMMKYDVMTVGNHEFDDGYDTLVKFVDSLDFPVITSDVTFGPELKDKIKPYTILEVGGQNIGVIGLTPPDSATLSSPGPQVKFSDDLVGIVQPIVDDLTKQGINKIMLLTHIGLVVDEDLATKLSGVDLIVGGHSHTLLSNTFKAAEDVYPVVVKDKIGNNVYIVQAGSSLKYLGRLNVQWDKDGVVTAASGDTILLSRYIQPDADMLKVVNELRAPISELTRQDIGESSVFLVGDRKICRVQECNLGNLITDAMRAYSKAQIAIENGGGIRSNVPVGADIPTDLNLASPMKVTEGDILTVLPFGNVVATFELKGSDVTAALENGVSQVEAGAGRFPQVSGIRFSWDGSKEFGKRIVSVDVLGEAGKYSAIDPEATYTVATNDFMRLGGDGYAVFNEKAINAYDGGSPLDLVLADYIKVNSPVNPQVEGRITRVDKS